MGDAACGDGLRFGDDVLAAAARLAGCRDMGKAAPANAGAASCRRADRLVAGRAGQCDGARQKGGCATGPNPTDRGKPGTKRHLVTDARGTPLGFRLTGANRHDSVMMASTLDAIPPLRGQHGRPRQRPAKLHADKAYDARARRQECRARGITPRIARRGVDTGERLGRHRWVVERTHAWFNRFRRIPIRHERRSDIYEAFISLAASIITINQIIRFC